MVFSVVGGSVVVTGTSVMLSFISVGSIVVVLFCALQLTTITRRRQMRAAMFRYFKVDIIFDSYTSIIPLLLLKQKVDYHQYLKYLHSC